MNISQVHVFLPSPQTFVQTQPTQRNDDVCVFVRIEVLQDHSALT